MVGNILYQNGNSFLHDLGANNTAVGLNALPPFFTGGTGNTAIGAVALMNNSGDNNTAIGYDALFYNFGACCNTAVGQNALFNNNFAGLNGGVHNTAVGQNALSANSTGFSNIAVGSNAGDLITGNNNIDIGNDGNASDNGVIRIGNGNNTAFFAAGVSGVTTGLSTLTTVLVDGNGQLGTISSSRRYKEDIQDMGKASSDLLRLRPVTFRYKKPYEDGSKPLDYGLIAEEVAEVYPDLVVRGKDGQIETVQYQKLTPMLLNEVQKQNQHAQLQDETIRLLEEQNRQSEEQNRQFETRLAALETLLSSKVPTTAATGQQENR
jgi:hypothetical protein